MARLLADTQGAKLTQVRGIGVVAASGLVAFVGDTSRWSEWSRVWRAAGLDPARSQSGPRDNAYGISREGSAWGRRAIMDLTVSVLRQRGPRQDRYLAARAAGKPGGIAITAQGNRLGRMCFALMASGDDYDADHETTRRRARKAGDLAALPEDAPGSGRPIRRRRGDEVRPRSRSLAPASRTPRSRPRMWPVEASISNRHPSACGSRTSNAGRRALTHRYPENRRSSGTILAATKRRLDHDMASYANAVVCTWATPRWWESTSTSSSWSTR